MLHTIYKKIFESSYFFGFRKIPGCYTDRLRQAAAASTSRRSLRNLVLLS